jgi:hypothetical protein
MPPRILMKHCYLVLFACALAGCASSPPAPRPGPDAAPDHRRLIAENLKTLFNPDSQVRNVVVSELRQVPSSTGLTWAACIRVSAIGQGGRSTGPLTYVVTFSRDTIAERRPASGQDCVGATFTPLS